MLHVFLLGWSFNSIILPQVFRAGVNTAPNNISNFFTPDLYEYDPPLTFANIARQLYAELKLQKEEIALVGWSMGGSIALELLSQYPDLPVSKLILMSSTAKFVNSDDYACGVTPAVARQLRQRIVKDVGQGLSFFHGLLGSQQDGTPLVLPEVSIVRDKGKLLDTLDELYRADYRQVLKGINVQTTIIHGVDDQVCPVSGAEYLAESLPNAELKLMEGEGHIGVISSVDVISSGARNLV